MRVFSVPTCPVCLKESQQREQRHVLSHKVLHAVGIGSFRCPHCDNAYVGFQCYGSQTIITLKSAREAAPVTYLCPSCGEKKMRRSHRRGVVEQVVSVFRIFPYRCEKCGHRFFSLKR